MDNIKYKIWTIDTPLDDLSTDEKVVFSLTKPYIEDFLCSSHPFRKGVMCPFVPSALKHNNVYFT